MFSQMQDLTKIKNNYTILYCCKKCYELQQFNDADIIYKCIINNMVFVKVCINDIEMIETYDTSLKKNEITCFKDDEKCGYVLLKERYDIQCVNLSNNSRHLLIAIIRDKIYELKCVDKLNEVNHFIKEYKTKIPMKNSEFADIYIDLNIKDILKLPDAIFTDIYIDLNIKDILKLPDAIFTDIYIDLNIKDILKLPDAIFTDINIKDSHMIMIWCCSTYIESVKTIFKKVEVIGKIGNRILTKVHMDIRLYCYYIYLRKRSYIIDGVFYKTNKAHCLITLSTVDQVGFPTLSKMILCQFVTDCIINKKYKDDFAKLGDSTYIITKNNSQLSCKYFYRKFNIMMKVLKLASDNDNFTHDLKQLDLNLSIQ
jgi:hypothetical protein